MKKTHRLVILLLLTMILLLPRPSAAQAVMRDLGTLGRDHGAAIALTAVDEVIT